MTGYSAAESVALLQTEEAQFKLDSLILMSEGIGWTISDGQPVLQVLGIISYDDESGTYRNAGIQREPVAITQQFQFRLEKTTIVGLCLRDRPVAGIQGTCKG